MMGFVDATNVTWLEEVLSWQDPELGCFKNILRRKRDVSEDSEMTMRNSKYKLTFVMSELFCLL